MAHYAQIDTATNIVLQVLVIDNAQEARDGEGGVGQWLKDHVNAGSTWSKTSYNARTSGYKKKYAGIGDTYDSQKNKFIPVQPYPSWSLDNQDDWQPPTPRPDGEGWDWDEETLSWIK